MLIIWFVIFIALIIFSMFFAWRISAQVERLTGYVFLGYNFIFVIIFIITIIKTSI